jgi:hypothetical protein
LVLPDHGFKDVENVGEQIGLPSVSKIQTGNCSGRRRRRYSFYIWENQSVSDYLQNKQEKEWKNSIFFDVLLCFFWEQ